MLCCYSTPLLLLGKKVFLHVNVVFFDSKYEVQCWTTTLKSPRHRGLCRWPRSQQLPQGLTWEVCIRVHATRTPAYSDTAAFFICSNCTCSFVQIYFIFQWRQLLWNWHTLDSPVDISLSFCSLLVPHLAPLSVCVSARVCMCVLGATLAFSQWYNCTSLDIKIDTFNSLSTFLSIHPTRRLRLPPPAPPKKPSLTNHSLAFVTKGEIMLIVIHRISQITNLFHLKPKLLRWVAAEATVALKAERRRGLNGALCLH